VQDNLLGKSVKLFLTKLINGFDQAPELIHLRAGDLGISDTNSFATFALRISHLDQSTDDSNHQLLHLHHELEQHLGSILKRRDIDWPVLTYEKDLLAIWPVSEDTTELYDELEQVLNLLQKQFPLLVLCIGVSERKTGLDKLADATEQARQALQFAVKHQHQRIFFYEQLGIARLYAAIPNRGLLSDFCKQHLGELCFARDTSTLEMKSTLNHYFNHFGHQQQTADAMGIHRNTLSYRLNRIEQRLGYSLQDSFLRLNLQNALLIEQILFHHHDIEEQANTLISPND
jgi:sugar diacid utilization regulator